MKSNLSLSKLCLDDVNIWLQADSATNGDQAPTRTCFHERRTKFR